MIFFSLSLSVHSTARRMLNVVVLLVVRCALGLIVHDASKTFSEDFVQYDCLDYSSEKEKLAFQDLSDVISEVIPFCFRPLIDDRFSLINTRDRAYSFSELQQLNLTSSDLLRWSSSINLIEEYQLFSSPQSVFFNCTSPWFGRRCEYSFVLTSSTSLNSILRDQWSHRDRSDLSVFPCYIHLSCEHVHRPMCLTWREICNGELDCLNDGIDERDCFELELNECDGEYRCHNGQCVDDDFFDDQDQSECLDRSDQAADREALNSCSMDPSFQCEEHSCRTNWFDFPCGDGQCVHKYDRCGNGRDSVLRQSVSTDDRCSQAMICATSLVENHTCPIEHLDECEQTFFFPSTAVLYGHVRLLYRNVNTKKDPFLPDFICYDSHLCDCLRPTYFHGNVSCIDQNQLDLLSTITGHRWLDMMLSLNSFFRSCRTISQSIADQSQLYQCVNSTKFISPHRIGDENFDCCAQDDEDVDLSCSISSKHRVQCPLDHRCLSSLHRIDDCPSKELHQRQIAFERLCDGLTEISFSSISTDESNCSYWPCDNLYSHCDGYATCANGEDEENCFVDQRCSRGTHLCLDRMNLTTICLEREKINDGIIHCRGATDERDFCRHVYPDEKGFRRFRCEQSDLCVTVEQLCDGIRTCPHGDDEDFCHQQGWICQETTNVNQTILQQIFCRENQERQKHFDRFILRTSSSYPKEPHGQTKPFLSSTKHQEEHQPVRSTSSWVWLCNRGLTVRQWLGNETFVDRCLCPSSYYGDRCEYENERVSLTLKFLRHADDQEKKSVYRFLILLIEDDAKIHSYEHVDYFTSETCSLKTNRYLLFSSRPKQTWRNYSIRIDRFEKRESQLIYSGTWQFPIRHLFLPVHRLAFLLSMSNTYHATFADCLLPCLHGQCLQYINRNATFCRCHSGWTGSQCERQLDCKHCATDSLCFGSTWNQSRCLCPFDRYGDHCALKWSCPPNTCLNNGQCLFNELRARQTVYQCLCPKEFFGEQCQWPKNQVELTFDHIEMSSFIIGYFLRLINPLETHVTMMIEKLTLFQTEIRFHLSISYNLLLIKFNGKYYLAVLQRETQLFLSAKINTDRECRSIEQIFNSSIRKLNRFDRLKLYHLPCMMDRRLECFYDESSLCLCTTDRHGNCFPINWNQTLRCPTTDATYCFNQGQCYQDHPTCPSTRLCLCDDCFFGDRCQFYAQGLGLTLDQILIYQIKIHRHFFGQKFPIQFTGMIILLIFVFGLFNGLCSSMVFSAKISREVGCGIYLFISSIVSLVLICCLTLKFAFLFSFTSRELLWINCFLLEPCLKIFSNIHSWLNACVACERAVTVFKGISFDKQLSQRTAKYVSLAVTLINLALYLPQYVNLHLYEDKKEERTLCAIRYSPLMDHYNTLGIFLHLFLPFSINLVSSILLIIGTTRQRTSIDQSSAFATHFSKKFHQHKYLVISPIVLVILSLPRVILSFTLKCDKSSSYFWLNLFAYLCSFSPSILLLVIFVLPSPVYKTQFRRLFTRLEFCVVVFRKE